MVTAFRDKVPVTPTVPLRGIHSVSHSLQLRLGFRGVPMIMLARAPCTGELKWRQTTLVLFFVASFVLALLAKICLGVVVVGSDWASVSARYLAMRRLESRDARGCDAASRPGLSMPALPRKRITPSVLRQGAATRLGVSSAARDLRLPIRGSDAARARYRAC